jgi:hypothetical protein
VEEQVEGESHGRSERPLNFCVRFCQVSPLRPSNKGSGARKVTSRGSMLAPLEYGGE